MIKFRKYHGLGNDYIYVDASEEGLDRWSDEALADAARLVSDRQFGIGGDGLILILTGTDAPPGMRIFNADGSEAEMCGNGIRCVAKYLFDHGKIGQSAGLSSKAGPIHVEIAAKDSSGARTVRVDMGPPRFRPEEIPAKLPTRRINLGGREIEAVIGASLAVGSTTYTVTSLSMGNPHCVIYVADIAELDLARIGPELEHHLVFPRRANIEFVEKGGNEILLQRTWERGSGETLACGTGACAVLVASVLNGIVERRAEVRLPGGSLEISWIPGESVFMTGSASFVYAGAFDLEALRLARRPA